MSIPKKDSEMELINENLCLSAERNNLVVQEQQLQVYIDEESKEEVEMEN